MAEPAETIGTPFSSTAGASGTDFFGVVLLDFDELDEVLFFDVALDAAGAGKAKAVNNTDRRSKVRRFMTGATKWFSDDSASLCCPVGHQAAVIAAPTLLKAQFPPKLDQDKMR